jgi:glycosyltransferase involved in cell wall biosynthesis
MKNKLNIAQITPYFYPAWGGIEKATLETSRRLVKKGHRVTVYTSKSKFSEFNTLPDEEIIDGIFVKRYPEYFNIMSTWFPKISDDEDILHFRNYNINPHTYLIGKYYKKKPILLTFHGGFSREESDFSFNPSLYGIGKYFWQYLYGKPYLKKIDTLIALHGWEKKNLISKGAPEERIKILPNGIGDEAFETYAPIKMDKPYIFNICRISSVKSLDHVIRILSRHPDIYYVVAGADPGGGELARLEQLAKALGVDGRVKFVGEKTGAEKYQYIAGAVALVVSSQWEMLSHSILEGMAQGKIVIASDSYGNPYIVDDLKTGFIYKYGDLDTLSELIDRAVKGDESMQACALAAKEKLMKEYRWDTIVDRLEEFYYCLIRP